MTLMHEGKIAEARAEMMRTLCLAYGNTAEAAVIAECSWPFYKHLIRKLGMRSEPAAVRARAVARFRLPLPGGDSAA